MTSQMDNVGFRDAAKHSTLGRIVTDEQRADWIKTRHRPRLLRGHRQGGEWKRLARSGRVANHQGAFDWRIGQVMNATCGERELRQAGSIRDGRSVNESSGIRRKRDERQRMKRAIRDQHKPRRDRDRGKHGSHDQIVEAATRVDGKVCDIEVRRERIHQTRQLFSANVLCTKRVPLEVTIQISRRLGRTE